MYDDIDRVATHNYFGGIKAQCVKRENVHGGDRVRAMGDLYTAHDNTRVKLSRVNNVILYAHFVEVKHEWEYHWFKILSGQE